MKRRGIVLFIFVLCTLFSCGTTENERVDVDAGTDDTVYMDSDKSYILQGARSIYIATFLNKSELTFFEEQLFEELKKTVPEETGLTLEDTPSDADIMLSGEIVKNAISVIESAPSQKPDFVNQYMLVNIYVKNKITEDMFTEDIKHYAYYNLITPPVWGQKEIYDEFATNMAQFIAEVTAYGVRKTRYEYGSTNKILLSEDTSIFSIGGESSTNTNTTDYQE